MGQHGASDKWYVQVFVGSYETIYMDLKKDNYQQILKSPRKMLISSINVLYFV